MIYCKYVCTEFIRVTETDCIYKPYIMHCLNFILLSLLNCKQPTGMCERVVIIVEEDMKSYYQLS